MTGAGFAARLAPLSALCSIHIHQSVRRRFQKVSWLRELFNLVFIQAEAFIQAESFI
jgi:hypothetical protein